MKRFSVTIAILLLCCIALAGCDGIFPKKQNGSASDDVQIIFFDIENEISKNGKSYTHYYGTDNNEPVYQTGVSPADCYMIKVGNTEILVDGGLQTYSDPTGGYNKRVAKIYQENVIKKINTYCTDGVLDYLIVTHGDYDHIAGLAVDGGLLDSYLESSVKQIGTIIDFDSDMVSYLSAANEITRETNLFFSSSATIDRYREKRNALIQKGTKHVPAACFFKGTDFLAENTLVNAMPQNRLQQYFRKDSEGNLNTEQIDYSLLTNFYYFSDNVILHNVYESENEPNKAQNIAFQSKYSEVDLSLGALKSENDRYYFSIPLQEKTELRILYNWSYDHFFNHSVDSQDRNNISVCFEIVAKEKKFVAFGDLGSAESGIIRYYQDTGMLKDVTCFKASHHGSTGDSNKADRENSAALYKLMQPEIVVVPGVAQMSHGSAAVMKKKFFENVKAGNPNAQIYCPQIVHWNDNGKENNHFETAPLHGDITVTLGGETKVDCSYKGEIDAYVSSQSEQAKHVTFYATKGETPLSFPETEYYDIIITKQGRISQ